MADQLQLRGAGETGSDAFTGAERELTVDVTNWNLRVHDGVTPGGHVINPSETLTSINSLPDVDTSTASPTNGQSLVWNSTNSKWEPSTVAGGSNSQATTFTWNAHLLPTTNEAYDLGSAEKKVRHLFLSDNSIKFENGTLGISNGNLNYNGNELTASFAVINLLNARLEALENQSNLILE